MRRHVEVPRRVPWAGVALLAICAVVLAACGGAPDGPGIDPLAVPGVAVFTSDGDLFVQEDGVVGRLVSAGEDSEVLSPALAPAGNAVAYVLLREDAQGRTSSELRLIASAGGGERTLLAPQQAGEFFWTPRWAADGGSIVYAHELPPANGQSGDPVIRVERIDIADRDVAVLRERARDPALSADGDRLLFVDLAPGDDELRSVELGSGAELTLVDASSGLSSFRVPQLSPDGRFVAFSASGDGPAAAAGAGLASSTRPVALRNGVQDLWLVAADGSGLRRLTTLLEDLPDFAWSIDGRHLLVRGAFGAYLVAVEAGTTETLGPGESHGGLDWRGLITAADG